MAMWSMRKTLRVAGLTLLGVVAGAAAGPGHSFAVWREREELRKEALARQQQKQEQQVRAALAATVAAAALEVQCRADSRATAILARASDKRAQQRERSALAAAAAAAAQQRQERMRALAVVKAKEKHTQRVLVKVTAYRAEALQARDLGIAKSRNTLVQARQETRQSRLAQCAVTFVCSTFRATEDELAAHVQQHLAAVQARAEAAEAEVARLQEQQQAQLQAHLQGHPALATHFAARTQYEQQRINQLMADANTNRERRVQAGLLCGQLVRLLHAFDGSTREVVTYRYLAPLDEEPHHALTTQQVSQLLAAVSDAEIHHEGDPADAKRCALHAVARTVGDFMKCVDVRRG